MADLAGDVHILVIYLLEIEFRKSQHLKLAVFYIEGSLQALCEIFGFKKISHTETYTAVFVGICRTDTFLCCADE